MGRQVLIAESRAGRPNDFSPVSVSEEESTSVGCPFCAGHENLTPEPELEISGPTGPWQVRVVPNKFPAVALDQQEFASRDISALDSVPQVPLGAHEVIIESPRHVQDITELSQAELARVLRVYRRRLCDWSTDERIQYVSIFKNVGSAAGASLGHIHSQLIALPDVPPVMATELQASQLYFAANQTCIFCQLLQEELRHRERVVIDEGPFVAFCAYAARQPYETWILPRSHAASFEHLSDSDTEFLAQILREVVRLLQTQLSPLSYNLVLHTIPFRVDATDHDHWHWHFELVPRSTQLAGFEWGSGMHINPLSPERAAARLRSG